MNTASENGSQRGKEEATILALWRSALGSEETGLDENFFDAGGSSLLAARLAGRLTGALGRSVTAADILSHPTARSLAAALGGAAPAMSRQQADQRAALQRRVFSALRTPRP